MLMSAKHSESIIKPPRITATPYTPRRNIAFTALFFFLRLTLQRLNNGHVITCLYYRYECNDGVIKKIVALEIGSKKLWKCSAGDVKVQRCSKNSLRDAGKKWLDENKLNRGLYDVTVSLYIRNAQDHETVSISQDSLITYPNPGPREKCNTKCINAIK